ncbi:hypothetical protein [Roseateles sp.]
MIELLGLKVILHTTSTGHSTGDRCRCVGARFKRLEINSRRTTPT